MKKRDKGKVRKLLDFEKKFEVLGLIVLVFIWALCFFTKISLSSLNVEVERLNKDVKNQTKENQSLVMKINELASLENIQAVANSEGLAYNNGNIVVVEEK